MLLIPVIDPGFVSEAALGSVMKTHPISHQMCHRRNPPLHSTVKYYQDLRQAILLNICSWRCSGSRLHLHTVSLLIGWWAPTAGVCVAPPSGQSFRPAKRSVWGTPERAGNAGRAFFPMQSGMMGMCATGAQRGVRADLRASRRWLQECIVSLLQHLCCHRLAGLTLSQSRDANYVLSILFSCRMQRKSLRRPAVLVITPHLNARSSVHLHQPCPN